MFTIFSFRYYMYYWFFMTAFLAVLYLFVCLFVASLLAIYLYLRWQRRRTAAAGEFVVTEELRGETTEELSTDFLMDEGDQGINESEELDRVPLKELQIERGHDTTDESFAEEGPSKMVENEIELEGNAIEEQGEFLADDVSLDDSELEPLISKLGK